MAGVSLVGGALAAVAAADTPLAESVDLEAVRLAGPPISALHHSLDRLSTLPTEGVIIELRCAVDRATARVTQCREGQGELSPEGTAATTRIKATKLDRTRIDATRREPLVLAARVKLLPGERRALQPPAELLSYEEVVWRQELQNEDRLRLEAVASRYDIQGRIALACEIQTDLSIVCLNKAGDGVYPQALVQAALDTAPSFRAGDTLRDGTPARGRWVVLEFGLTRKSLVK
jgi:hypothetical protein